MDARQQKEILTAEFSAPARILTHGTQQMATDNSKTSEHPDIEELTQNFFELARKNQEIFAKLLEKNQQSIANPDPLNAVPSLTRAAGQLSMNPNRLMQANLELWQKHMLLWQNAAGQLAGQPSTPVAKPDRGDRRFRHADWDENPLFDFIKQSYLITSQWLVSTMSQIDGIDKEDARKVEFYTKQFADAFSPTNFLWTNPEALRATLESGGDNLKKGMENFCRDMERGDGSLKMTMVDADAFELGRNIATTPGKVVYQNDLIQLLQFTPRTEEVHRVPLLIVPPWINKYYILDLREDNSFIRWMLDQGFTVFVVSWVNPDESLAGKTFGDYMQEGILDAVDAVIRATGEQEISAIGYCIGGTLLGATLAYMAACDDRRIKAATFFAAQTDFSEAGDLKVFIDEQQLESLDDMMAEKGYLEGSAMSTTFNMLRSNDLIWSFYVNNYLLGKDPAPFDLLYWNADATRMPRNTHMFYLREMYLHNNLAKPGGIELKGVPIDLTRVNIPVYLQASKDDHIAPYPSVFKARNQYSGPVRFVLSGSGHIAGVINPPAANKYQYWLNEQQPPELEEWLAGAQEHAGSWWPDWGRWLSEQSGPMVPARQPGDGALEIIEDAPGSYVKTTS